MALIESERGNPGVADRSHQRPAAQPARRRNIAVRNARNVKFDNVVCPKVTEVPEYAEPETENVETAAVADEFLAAVRQ
jgi:hypothetical protein